MSRRTVQPRSVPKTPRHSSNNKIFEVFEMDDGVLTVEHDNKRNRILADHRP